MQKAIIFDFDGVVVKSEPLHYRTFAEILSRYGVKIARNRWYGEFAGTGSRSIIRRLLEENNVEADVLSLVEERKALYRKYVEQGKLKPNKGLRRFLTKLKTEHPKLGTAIASGGHSSNIKAVLRILKLTDYFETVVGAEDVKYGKPNPEGFLLAAKRLRVDPKNCIVIEDSIPGSIAANRAGMKLVCFDSPARNALNNSAIKIITEYSEFPFELLE
jgi:beta-phosphoglucomutase